MNHCYIGLGGNLGDAAHTIQSGVQALKNLPDSQFVGLSNLYQSKPMGPQDQPDYINAVAHLQTNLAPLQLLDALQAIEAEHGRVRGDEHWGARTLDLDILLFGQQTIDLPRLSVPHPGMREREFVLYPLYDLQPQLIFADGVPLAELLKTIPTNGMTVYPM